jgi:uncharacterized protein YebE (UPF0316 family)
MEFLVLSGQEIYVWIGLPILIFIARVCDVSLGTIRIIFISKGIKYLAPLVGFFEILIWIMAISQIMQNLSNVYYYLFYAGGFATGNFVGILIDEKLSIGNVNVRIITRHDANDLVEKLKKSRFGITVLDAEGPKGQVKIIFTLVKRKNVAKVIKLVKKYNPQAFYSVEDIRFVSEPLPSTINPWYEQTFNRFKRNRKAK